MTAIADVKDDGLALIEVTAGLVVIGRESNELHAKCGNRTPDIEVSRGIPSILSQPGVKGPRCNWISLDILVAVIKYHRH